MSRSHPFLNIDHVSDLSFAWLNLLRLFFIRLGLSRTFQVRAEVLKKCDLLLKCGGVLLNVVFFTDVLSVSLSALDIVKVITVGVEHYLGSIVEENSNRRVGKVIA